MAFEYGCFISYAHDDGERIQQFIADFTSGLTSVLGDYLDSPNKFWLDKERLSGGVAHPHAIARAMCLSACWILVYIPKYRRKSWCRQEYRAMRALEAQRRATLGKRLPRETAMIIPVLLSGHLDDLPRNLPSEVYVEREFQAFNVGQPRILHHPDFQPRMIEIGSRIWDAWRIYEDLEEPQNCAGFRLPDDSLDDWGDEVGGPNQRRPI